MASSKKKYIKPVQAFTLGYGEADALLLENHSPDAHRENLFTLAVFCGTRKFPSFHVFAEKNNSPRNTSKKPYSLVISSGKKKIHCGLYSGLDDRDKFADAALAATVEHLGLKN